MLKLIGIITSIFSALGIIVAGVSYVIKIEYNIKQIEEKTNSIYAAKQGPMGPKGEKGNRGERGYQGEKGQKGEKGYKGATGNIVDNYTIREIIKKEIISHLNKYTFELQQKADNILSNALLNAENAGERLQRQVINDLKIRSNSLQNEILTELIKKNKIEIEDWSPVYEEEGVIFSLSKCIKKNNEIQCVMRLKRREGLKNYKLKYAYLKDADGQCYSLRNISIEGIRYKNYVNFKITSSKAQDIKLIFAIGNECSSRQNSQTLKFCLIYLDKRNYKQSFNMVIYNVKFES
jgi:hypothetical protein